MPPRRAAAMKAQQPPSDIESEDENGVGNSASEDEDMNSDVEIDEPESEDPDEEYPDMLESEDDEPVPNAPESSLEASAANSPFPKAGPSSVLLKPTLRVKLKLGSRPTRLPESTVASSAASVTPEPDIIPGRRSGKRAIIYDEDDDMDELEDAQSVQSSSRMTARQAALATGLEAGHIELPTSKKKKVMTPAEIATRRSESAIKRKHLTEKKLEDDKTETINRLLKKQSAGTRRKKALEEAQQGNGDNKGPGGSSSTARQNVASRPSVPSFRWISTSRRPVVLIAEGDNSQTQTQTKDPGPPTVSFSFSIPPEFLPPVPKPPSSPTTRESSQQATVMEGVVTS